MVRSVTLVVCGIVSFAAAHAELLLMPKVLEYNGDGATLRQLAFFDGSKIVTYQSPRGWKYSGNSTQLTLRPPGKTQTEATITRISLSEPACFDDESLAKLVTEAIAQLPKGSEGIYVTLQEKNPLMIQSKETFLVIINYTAFGEKYSRSILFLNREKDQIRSQLTCRQEDFEGLQRAFLRSQYTWQNL